MSKFKIPASIDRATSSLTTLDGLVTASEWQRAAIVFAFVTPQQGSRTSASSRKGLSVGDFIALGVRGLTTYDSVRRYRSAWQAAIDAGQVRAVAPGDDVVLPELPFPPHAELAPSERADALAEAAVAEGAGVRSTQQIATHLPALRAAIRADPKVAAAAREALDQRQDVPTPSPRQSSPAREGLELLADFRALHKTLASILDRILGGSALIVPTERDALLAEVQWLRNALDHVESGLASDSLDAELAAFLGSQS